MHDVIIMAFEVDTKTENPQTALMGHLQHLVPETWDTDNEVVSWWIAQDERLDGSDNDSAVFVKKGNEREAQDLLKRYGLAH